MLQKIKKAPVKINPASFESFLFLVVRVTVQLFTFLGSDLTQLTKYETLRIKLVRSSSCHILRGKMEVCVENFNPLR